MRWWEQCAGLSRLSGPRHQLPSNEIRPFGRKRDSNPLTHLISANEAESNRTTKTTLTTTTLRAKALPLRWWWKCRVVLALLTLSWLTSGSACADVYADDSGAIECLTPAPFQTSDGQVWIVPVELDCFDLSTDEDLWAI